MKPQSESCSDSVSGSNGDDGEADLLQLLPINDESPAVKMIEQTSTGISQGTSLTRRRMLVEGILRRLRVACVSCVISLPILGPLFSQSSDLNSSHSVQMTMASALLQASSTVLQMVKWGLTGRTNEQ